MHTIWTGDALGTLWNALERCGALWGRFGDALGRSGDALGRSGALLGRSGTLWDTWECSGMMLGVVVMMMIVFHSSIYTNFPINRLRGRYVTLTQHDEIA